MFYATTTFSTISQNEFNEGDAVMVSNGGTLKKRIFIAKAGDKILAVHKQDEELYRNGDSKYRVGVWSVIEKYVPQYGDKVEVSNGGEVFKERYFLTNLDNGKILAVDNRDRQKFENGDLNFRTAEWNVMR